MMKLMKKIPQMDPRTGYLAQKTAIDDAVLRVLGGGSYILGHETAKFEEEFSDYLGGAVSAVGVGSGTDALHLALRTLGVGLGDAVITVSHTAVATVAAIELAGSTPILVDVESERMTMDPAAVEHAITTANSVGLHGLGKGRIKAIIPVHLYGQPADMEAIMSIARKHDLWVIEDCAQAHGADIAGQRVGTWGHMAAFSFYPTKNLGAFGDGGALVSKDLALANRSVMLRQYGWKERYISCEPGMNTRLDEMQAAILRVRLLRLDEDNERRSQIAALYDQALGGVDIHLPTKISGTRHAYHQYVIRTHNRADLQTFLENYNISTAILYPQPVHAQSAYRDRVPQLKLPRTDKVSQEILSLPMYPGLTDDQVDRVCNRIIRWFER